MVTVPAYFDDNQRSATKDTCRIASLEVARLVNEPTAASLAYGLDRLGQELRIAVIDFGGGTLDVTIMEFGKGVFEVKATSGDTQLGGTDMNQRVCAYLTQRFQDETGADASQDRQATARLLEAAEKIAKIELSTNTTTHISLPFLMVVAGTPRHLEMDMTRTDLERLVRPVIERCRGPVEQALHDASVSIRDIDRLVFVGGPTRMPVVRSYFEELFGRQAEMGVDPIPTRPPVPPAMAQEPLLTPRRAAVRRATVRDRRWTAIVTAECCFSRLPRVRAAMDAATSLTNHVLTAMDGAR